MVYDGLKFIRKQIVGAFPADAGSSAVAWVTTERSQTARLYRFVSFFPASKTVTRHPFRKLDKYLYTISILSALLAEECVLSTFLSWR